MLKGIGASQGYGIGNAVVINDASLDYNHIKYTSADEEKERLQKAVDSFLKKQGSLFKMLKKVQAIKKRKY
jgi:phosphotransferase system enzyme I (PtsI)